MAEMTQTAAMGIVAALALAGTGLVLVLLAIRDRIDELSAEVDDLRRRHFAALRDADYQRIADRERPS